MAAVICGGIGKCVGGCCECAGQVCMAPFKICGACCEGCGQCCQDSCKLVTNVCTGSFSFYIIVTCFLNIPPIVVGLMDVPNIVDGCQASYWLLVFWILCAINIVAAFYMARAVDQDNTILPSNEQQGMSNFNASSGASRMKHLFCYDGWMALYILILCGFFVWILLGAGLFVTEDDNEECDDSMGNVGIAYGFGWTFVFMGGCALCCSLCCGLFSRPSQGNHFVNTQQRPPQQQSATVAAASQTTSGIPDKKNQFGASSTTTATPAPAKPSAPPEVEVPVASAEPIYDDDVPATKASVY